MPSALYFRSDGPYKVVMATKHRQAASLNDFTNALRECLGLAPLPTHAGNTAARRVDRVIADAFAGKASESDVRQALATAERYVEVA